MGLSVCIIAGNVEHYIARCLNSVRSFADEIVVVRAIGNQKPDRTLDIAREMGATTAEYKNQKSDWPHVDDFAAARQMAFDLATHTHSMWIDTDDVFEGDPSEIISFVRENRFAVLMMPYYVTGRGLIPKRERVMRRDAGKWKYPVHECFKLRVPGGLVDEAKRCRIVHLADPDLPKDKTRNLRILESIPRDGMNTGLMYHLFAEYQMAGQGEKALEVANSLLDRPDLGAAERYELILNVAAASPHEARRDLYAAAYHTDPKRREALLLLAGNALERRAYEDGLAYARQAMATPMPANPHWNNRGNFYGWIGRDTFEACLRANGLDAEAARHRLEFIRQCPPRISLLHATRGRPQQAIMARKIWMDYASEPDKVEHIFAVDDDDKTSGFLRLYNHVSLPKGGGCVAAWNGAAFHSRGEILVQMSDDFIPPMQWDKIIAGEFERAGGLDKPLVLHVNDGYRSDNLMAIAIATRKYVALDNFLFHPDFRGVFSDNWFGEVARKRGVVIDARERITFKHDHPAFTGKPADETYMRQNAPEEYEYGEAVIQRLRRGNDWSSVEGWFDYWPFYKQIAEVLPDGARIAEVGVYKGRSVVYLAQMLKRLGKNKCKIFAVDLWRDASFDVFCDTIKRCHVADMVIPHQDFSDKASGTYDKESIDFIWIDAAHDYESVCKDIRAWLPKLSPNGIMAGHDADAPDVARAVADTIKARTFGNVWIKE